MHPRFLLKDGGGRAAEFGLDKKGVRRYSICYHLKVGEHGLLAKIKAISRKWGCSFLIKNVM